MNINLTKQEIDFLKQYANVYEEERKADNTADPIVLVQEKYKMYVDLDCYYDDLEYEVFINGYNCTEDFLLSNIDEVKDCIKEYFEDDEEFKGNMENCIKEFEYSQRFGYEDEEFEYRDEEADFTVVVRTHYYTWEYRTKAYFFTRKEAEKYIKYQGHNLNEPRVYTDYAGYSNRGDYPTLSKLLLRMGQEIENAN